ncbi:MAG: hypothetical protein BMS9Abin33_0180 [Gammaproteobacteria bacterium]|nr:MAG: hypothetical protein BMS9Abin33_0180 [Gammaproteobacteria bacterium]
MRPLHGLDFLSRQGKNQRESRVYTLVNEHFERVFNAVLEAKTFVQKSQNNNLLADQV